MSQGLLRSKWLLLILILPLCWIVVFMLMPYAIILT